MILEEERKVIAAGVKSLQVVLPKFWTDFKGIKKGDTLKVVITDKALIMMKADEDYVAIKQAFGLMKEEPVGGVQDESKH
jgi:bifunctional DNA-binding transcriptional regulator/antitoxin component of YhaV-PrlF toxin-antitoxin module